MDIKKIKNVLIKSKTIGNNVLDSGGSSEMGKRNPGNCF